MIASQIKALPLRFTKTIWAFLRAQWIAFLVSVVAIGGGLLAFLHHAAFDIYLIGCEWILFLAFLFVASKLWSKHAAPLCHIIFISRQGDDYVAHTEYYTTTHNSGPILANALQKARDEGMCSVTYYEQGKQYHIPLPIDSL